MKKLALCLILLTSTAWADEAKDRRDLFQSLTQDMRAGNQIELRALEIQAKIYEPSVIYVLDRAKIEIDFKEQDVSFSPRIMDPILENEF